MATLSIDKRSGKTAGYNIQWHEGKKRRTIHLGSKRYSKKTALRLKEIIEELLYYQRNGITVPGKATEHWLKNAPACIRAKLAKASLLTVQEAKTCQQLWDEFLKQKTDIKSKTVKAYNECRVHFFKAFAPEESVETITSERLQEWKHSLLKTHAVASVAGYIKNLKAVLKWAVKKEWLPKNPLEGITRGSFVNRDNDRIISRAEYAKCPSRRQRVGNGIVRAQLPKCSWRTSVFTSYPNKRYTGSPKLARRLARRLGNRIARNTDHVPGIGSADGSHCRWSIAVADIYICIL